MDVCCLYTILSISILGIVSDGSGGNEKFIRNIVNDNAEVG